MNEGAALGANLGSDQGNQVGQMNGDVWALANSASQHRARHLIYTMRAVDTFVGCAGSYLSYEFSRLNRISVHRGHPFASISVSQLPVKEESASSRYECKPRRFEWLYKGIFDVPRALGGRLGSAPLATLLMRQGELTLDVNLDKAGCIRLQETQIRALFDELDRNKDGMVDQEEMMVLLHLLGLPCTSEYLSDLMAQYNSCGKKQAVVPYANFARYVRQADARMRRAFRALDVEQDGMITESGLLRALREMGLPAQPSDARRMIQLLDKNRDGVVRYTEFCRYACLLPHVQLANGNIAWGWVDSTDYIDGVEARLSMTPAKQTGQRLLAGGMAGVISRTIVAPLERLRTIMMASSTPLTRGAAVRAMWRDGGALGMFKGNAATVVKVLPGSAVQFAVYDGVKDILSSLRPPTLGSASAGAERLVAGAIAGAASCFVTHPLETVRTRMSVPGGATGSFFQALSSAVQRRGIIGLYAGFSSSLLGDMLGTGLGFMAYEAGQTAFTSTRGRKPNAQEKGFIGAGSAVIVMTGTMPLELIQRRMQIAATPAGASFQYRGTIDAFVTILRKEGYSAFFRGSVFTYCKVFPSIGVMYCMYDLISHAMAVNGLRMYEQDPQDLLQRRRKQVLLDPGGLEDQLLKPLPAAHQP